MGRFQRVHTPCRWYCEAMNIHRIFDVIHVHKLHYIYMYIYNNLYTNSVISRVQAPFARVHYISMNSERCHVVTSRCDYD